MNKINSTDYIIYSLSLSSVIDNHWLYRYCSLYLINYFGRLFAPQCIGCIALVYRTIKCTLYTLVHFMGSFHLTLCADNSVLRGFWMHDRCSFLHMALIELINEHLSPIPKPLSAELSAWSVKRINGWTIIVRGVII